MVEDERRTRLEDATMLKTTLKLAGLVLLCVVFPPAACFLLGAAATGAFQSDE